VLLSRAALRSLVRARELLETNEPAPVAEIARAVGMSPFHFIRRFESVYGATPHQLRIRIRLERAKHLLALDRSVTDVCFDLGFSSLGSFSAAFARRLGESPSAYQRRARRLVQVPTALGHALYPGCLALMARLPADAFAISKKRSAPRSATLRA
jgi:AraC-like DNA-binding protein